MKYIRTKDGRVIDLTSKQVSSYEIIDDDTAIAKYGEDSGFIMVYYYNRDIGAYIEYDGKGGRSMNSWYLKDILKQADTIEEVFDQLVYVEDTIPEDIYPALMSPKGIIQSQIVLGCTKVYKLENFKYGIWTKKGLKYVAEFNDKGELKLI